MKRKKFKNNLLKVFVVTTVILILLNTYFIFVERSVDYSVENLITLEENTTTTISDELLKKVPLKLRGIAPFLNKTSLGFIGYKIKPLRNRHLPVSPFQSKYVSNAIAKPKVDNSLYSEDYKRRFEEWSSVYESQDYVPEEILSEYPDGFTREIKNPYSKRFKPASEMLLKRCRPADGFDMPCGAPDGRGYYIAQIFGNEENHMGEDWNGRAGGNSDLGDPVYAIADGAVYWGKLNKGSWGNLVRLIHNIGTMEEPVYVESLYAHLDTIMVWEGQEVVRGQQIGTIGDAHGHFSAHLHLEIRKNINTPIGKAYTTDTIGFGYTQPLPFIESRRPNNYTPTRSNGNYKTVRN